MNPEQVIDLELQLRPMQRSDTNNSKKLPTLFGVPNGVDSSGCADVYLTSKTYISRKDKLVKNNTYTFQNLGTDTFENAVEPSNIRFGMATRMSKYK